ncbi:MAG: DMT family transporter [Pseudomonadota bacterium]
MSAPAKNPIKAPAKGPVGIPANLAYAAVLVGVLGHASSEFFAVLSGIGGAEVSVWRYVLGGFGLIVVGLLLAGPRALIAPMRSHGWPITLYSLVGVSLAYLAFHLALDYATVIQVATLVTTIPIFIGLANLWLNGQPFTRVKIAVGACAMAGLVLLITDGALDALVGDASSLLGIFLGVLCAAAVGWYALKIKPIIAEHGAVPVTAVSMMIGGVALWIGVGIGWGVWVDPTTLFDRPAVEWGSLLALALWNTTITQILWIGGLAAAPDITRAGYLFFLKPVIAAVLAIAILGEEMTLLKGLAILVVTGSVLVELFWPRIEAMLGAKAAGRDA